MSSRLIPCITDQLMLKKINLNEEKVIPKSIYSGESDQQTQFLQKGKVISRSIKAIHFLTC
jgi:hypothetical protein